MSVKRHFGKEWLAIAAVAVLAGVLGFRDIGNTPIYLGGDEAHFAVHAHAIATTGHDLNGRVMPLFFNLADPLGDYKAAAVHRWYQPTLFYLTALVLKFVPVSEASVRAPTAFIGVLDALLMFALARRFFAGWFYPTLAAVLLVASPAHMILSRQATDYICFLPFILGWLWCLAESVETGGLGPSFFAGLLLGLGFFSYLAAWGLTPLYLALTWIAQYRTRRAVAPLVASGIGFVLPLLPVVPWLIAHPDMLRETMARYGAAGAAHGTLLDAARTFFRFGNIQQRISVYWDYFDPAFLFLTGGLSLTTATSRAGVFLLPVAALLPVGIYALLAHEAAAAIGMVLLVGLASAPIPAALVGERYMIQRALFLLPFGALISTFGLAFWLRQPRAAVRACAVVLLVALPIQFAYFYRMYFTSYRSRAAKFYDAADFRDAAEYVMASNASGRLPKVYLSRRLDEGSARWRFFVTKHHHEDLLTRTVYFDGDGMDAGDAPIGTLMVMPADEHTLAALLNTKEWSVEKAIVDNDGDVASTILRKVR